MPRVEALASFRADVEHQVAYLRTSEPSLIARTLEAVRDARDMLADFPYLGREITHSDGAVRALTLRRVPFVIWYVVEEQGQVVHLLRLFHARQHRRRG